MPDFSAHQSVFFGLLLVFLLVFSLSGCGNNGEDPAPGFQMQPAEEAEKAQKGRLPQQPELELVDAKAYHDIIRQHEGDFIVVDFWATWCPPCIASFPELVKLHREYRNRGVTVIGVSADFPGERDKVKDFLEEQEADFKNLKIGADNIDDFVSSVSKGWQGDLPAVFLYNRSGEIIGEYIGSGALGKAESQLSEHLGED